MQSRVNHLAVNLVLALVYGLFATIHIREFAFQPRLSLILIVGMETVLVLLFLTRKQPDRTWHSWQTWLTTAAGTLFPLLLRPTAEISDSTFGQAVQIAGLVLALVAVLSLNRSMGLLPAHRGVKSSGLYRLVRHPLYMAYTIMLVGYLASNFSLYNFTVIAVGTMFQVLRLKNEESLLLQYPEYVAFTAKTRWRLVPFVW